MFAPCPPLSKLPPLPLTCLSLCIFQSITITPCLSSTPPTPTPPTPPAPPARRPSQPPAPPTPRPRVPVCRRSCVPQVPGWRGGTDASGPTVHSTAQHRTKQPATTLPLTALTATCRGGLALPNAHWSMVTEGLHSLNHRPAPLLLDNHAYERSKKNKHAALTTPTPTHPPPTHISWFFWGCAKL